MRFLLVILAAMAILTVLSAPAEDKIAQIPGYPPSFTVRAYGGYLDTTSSKRSLHYIFIEHSSAGPSNNETVVLWLNGGPGCTSLIGFVQEIAPYVLEEGQPYDGKKQFTMNPYSWSNKANLLFIDAPAGAGYSINTDPNYIYTDEGTARDTLQALKHFFTRKFTEYSTNTFYIAGQSYAGKMIPDLAMKILGYNADKPAVKINLQGLLIANGVYSFEELENSRVEFMISHNFIDPRLVPYWERSCKTDASSAGCSYFYERYEDLLYRIDEYNIYGMCYGRKGPPQRALMADLSLKFSKYHHLSKRYGPEARQLQAGEWCSYDQGVEDYINANGQLLKSIKTDRPITECNMTIYLNYEYDPMGSYLTIPKLLKSGLRVYLFSGDWDDVVPFTDTYKNIYKMGLKQYGPTKPMTLKAQHIGFKKEYKYGKEDKEVLRFYLIKGAGHEVPLYQRERSYHVFEEFLLGQ